MIAATLMLTACDHLDFDETSRMSTLEALYHYNATNAGNIESLLTNVYTYMPIYSYNTETTDCASDDAELGNTAATVQNVNNGSWSSNKTWETAWGLYAGIRAVNSFIEEVAKVDYSLYQFTSTYQNKMKKLRYYPYEARVLRAYFFFELARRYGDIAMPTQMLDETAANAMGKTPFSDVIRFIVDECETAADSLPDSYVNEPDAEIGRMTKGFAMALKSKALLYAASALHNPGGDVERWKTSALAAQDIIDLGLYQLDPAGVANRITSPEAVLMRALPATNGYELANYPLRFTEGARSGSALANGKFPSQNLVDAFETVNGYPVTLTANGWQCDDPAFDPQRPYERRDPRFARTILANGMTFRSSVVEVFSDGLDDHTVPQGGSATGYFLRKYLQETTSFRPGATVTNRHAFVIYRYAETLLTYAESMIEAFGDCDHTDATYTRSARWALNEVRANAGMPLIVSCSKEEFTSRLRNEWRVEFAFEEHRFWDVRRWKTGSDTQRELYGVRIVKENNQLRFYRFLYETRTWNERMNLFPIPKSELFKNSNLLPQNPGWE
jgi:hypothetical protein